MSFNFYVWEFISALVWGQRKLSDKITKTKGFSCLYKGNVLRTFLWDVQILVIHAPKCFDNFWNFYFFLKHLFSGCSWQDVAPSDSLSCDYQRLQWRKVILTININTVVITIVMNVSVIVQNTFIIINESR